MSTRPRRMRNIMVARDFPLLSARVSQSRVRSIAVTLLSQEWSLQTKRAYLRWVRSSLSASDLVCGSQIVEAYSRIGRSRVLKHSVLICLGVPARFLCRNALVHSWFHKCLLRCGHNQKKGVLGTSTAPQKGEFRTDLVKREGVGNWSYSKGVLGAYLYFYLTIWSTSAVCGPRVRSYDPGWGPRVRSEVPWLRHKCLLR